MKRKHQTSAAAAEAEAAEPSQAPLPLEAFSGDVSAALTARYGRSAAPQHRHLLASAAAIRSILVDDGLPLTPASYLPAAVSALRAAGPSDPAAASALASLLAILLPHIPSCPSSLPPAAASESASALAAFLSSHDASRLPTGTVRSVVKSLGHLVLHLDAAADWDAVTAPLDALLSASVDQRAKVRRCAQESVEKLFSFLEHSGCAKKASDTAIGMFEKHISALKNLGSDASEAKETEAVHMLGVVAVLVPYLSKKARKKVFSDAYQLLSPCFSPITRHVLRLMETLLEHLKAENIESELENLMSLVLAYLPFDEKKPGDTILAALQLMKNCLTKLASHPELWMKALPSAFESVSGYLILDRKCSEDIAQLLQDCIDSQLDQSILLTNGSELHDCDVEGSSDGAAIKSICLSINDTLRTCASPPDSILAVVFVLFLKLGESSYVFMKDILLTLSQFATRIDKEPQLKNVEECIGAAVIALGPDKILSLIPIAFDEDRLTLSNTWLLPILDKYIYGGSLQQFLEYIVPLATSVQNASSRVEKGKERIRKKLQSRADQLWNLLPAFCRYPIDVYQNFGSLSSLLVEMSKCDRCLYKPAVKALQQLVDGTRRLSSSDQDTEISAELSALFSSKTNKFICPSIGRRSRKDARKSMKVLTSHSSDLLCIFADYFLDSSPEKRAHLKDALRCLAQLSGSKNICNLFLTLVKRFGLEDTPLEPENLECETYENIDVKDEGNTDSADEINNKWSLLMELISTFAEAADENLLDLFFRFIKSSLLNSSKSCEGQDLVALSIILKEHTGYSLSRVDEIMLLLHGIKHDLDDAVLKGQLLCYQYLLVHMIKANEENTSKKAFLILNELILALKSKKESRRLAYDVLLATSTILRSSESKDDSDLQRLFTMVMGYLSSPSPHIVSGAIAALSLLIYNDATFCMEVPNLIPSVLAFLQHKAIEVIKVALGFVKVLVTSLPSEKLLNLQADIMSGVLPWSSVTKHHFKGKVVLILEILIRKCGFDAVNLVTPEKYKAFVRSVEEGRNGNHNPADGVESEAQNAVNHTPTRRKKVDSNAEAGEEKTPSRLSSKGRPSGKKEFFRKGPGKAHSPGGKSQQSKASGSKGDRTNFKSKSKAQPGNNESNKGDRFQGRNKRPRGEMFNKTRNQRFKASKESSRFKKPRTAAAT